MTLEQINDAIRTAGDRVNTLSGQLAMAATMPTPSLDDVARLREELNRENTRLLSLRESAAAMGGAAPMQPQQPQGLTPAQDKSQKEIRASNEYARAFAYAIRHGLTPDTGVAHAEKIKPLYDALSIGGGDPTGADGGFLVPEDIDHSIHELQRTLNPLRAFFAVESVTAPSGWRVTDIAPTTGFTQVNELATVPQDDQPVFGKATYSLTKFGLILPISKELAMDEVANLFGYISRWAAKKETITENTLLLSALTALAAGAVTLEDGKELAGIKKILNVSLDPAIGSRAVILTNQDGFNMLDSLEDNNGRPLLQWDPTTGTTRMLGGKRVGVVSNLSLPSASSPDLAPLYIGDGEQFATLFERAPMEVLSTNIGGTAFTTDSIQIRFIKRMGVSTFDTGAMKMAKAPF